VNTIAVAISARVTLDEAAGKAALITTGQALPARRP
jgi:hypothetical protein